MALKPGQNASPAVFGPIDDKAQIIAQAGLHPTAQAARTIQHYTHAGDGTSSLNIFALVGELAKEVAAVSGGNLGRAEAMLLAQAHSLDAIYGNLARRAAVQESIPNIDGFLRLALKAQSQCRATLETLAAIKNPPNVAFVGQANISQGPQQINNGADPVRGRENGIEQSKLSGGSNELLPDTRASTFTGRANPQLATVGKINRSKISKRKS